MPRLDDASSDLIQALEDHYGLPSMRSPVLPSAGEDQAELLFKRLVFVALGLVAAPNVASHAFDALSEAGLLDPNVLAVANPFEVDDTLKNARVAMAIKSLRPLQKLARWFSESIQPLGANAISPVSTERIREEWRAINGIGLASADALLLFGLGRVSYPVDRATYRVLVRHGWLDLTAEYEEARSLIERVALKSSDRSEVIYSEGVEEAVVSVLARMSFWLERIGRDFCKPSRADCERCPLKPWLPLDGPVEVDQAARDSDLTLG